MNYHKPVASNKRIYSLMVLKVRSPKLRCKQDHAPSEDSRERPVPSFLLVCDAAARHLVLWTHHSSLRLCCHMTRCLWLWVSSSFCIRTPVKLGVTNYTCNDPIPKWYLLWGPGKSMHFWGTLCNPLYPGSSYKCKFLGPTPDLLNQNFWGRVPAS